MNDRDAPRANRREKAWLRGAGAKTILVKSISRSPHVMKLEIQPFIFTWKRQFQKACVIEDQLREIFPAVVVINSDDENTRPGWINIGNSCYFTDQFRKALEIFSGDVLFHIQADVEYDNWRKLVEDAKFYFRFYDAGIYAPHVDYTFWTAERSDVPSDALSHSHLKLVGSTDETVWFIRKEILEGIQERGIDMSLNPFGWGWDCSLSCISYAKAMPVIRDYRHTIRHPKGTGYNTNVAETEMSKHFGSLDDDLQKLYSYIRGDRQNLARYLKKEPELPRVLGSRPESKGGLISRKRLGGYFDLSPYKTFVHVGASGMDGVQWAMNRGMRGVYAVMASRESFEEARKVFTGRLEVRLQLGEIKTTLAQIVKQIQGPALFYIDSPHLFGTGDNVTASENERTALLREICAALIEYVDIESSLIVVEDIPFKVSAADESASSKEERRTWLLEHWCSKHRFYATYLDDSLVLERPK